MIEWGKYPFVRLLIPFVIGIWCFVSFASFRMAPVTLVLVALALFALAVMASCFEGRSKTSWLFGVVMNCYLFCVGYAMTQVHDATVRKTYFRNFEAEAGCYVARVWDCPLEKDNTVKAVLALDAQYGDSFPERKVTGRIIAYFQKTDAAMCLNYGDLLVVPAPIEEVSPPKNPEEFNYCDYLNRKGITGQVYLKDSDWVATQVNRANPVYAFSYRFRDVLLRSLQRCGLKGDEYGVAAAILLGYDDSLPVAVRQNYVAAGSMHILCVSGMHVGIIYLLAASLLGFLKRKKWQIVMKNVLLLGLIWFYALIAGLSPSILRASMMISFVVFGDLIRRKGFAVNSIAASAFVLLCANPNNLFEIGFLLSYIAVIGIVVLQKPIYGWLSFRNKLLDKTWEITAVALAAQFATMPVTLYYFHQFTIYFWLSNLFMTPVSFVVIMGGMMLLLVSWIPYVNVFMGYLVWGAVYLMNWIVGWIESLPGSIVKGLYINGFEFAMLLTVFLFILLMVVTRRRHYFLAALSCLLLCMASVTIRKYQVARQDEIVVYSLRKHMAVDVVKGNQHVLVCDSALVTDEGSIDYSLRGNWAKCGLSSPVSVFRGDDFENGFVSKKGSLISASGILMALWEGNQFDDTLSFRVPVDFVLVTEKQQPDVSSVLRAYKVGMLLIDGSVPHYLAEKWGAQADACGLPYYYVGDRYLRLKKEMTNPEVAK